jgi:hypothetical protein|tara:strand:- start:155 stop:1774 length:1620 start_codon:yes stop_codon:yes gene_type:complete
MNEIYNNNPNLKGSGVQIQWTEEQAKEYVKCMEDPIYFIKTYVKIVNLDQGLINFEMYPFQEKMVKSFYDNRFTICKIGRQSGKSITSIAFFLHYILFNKDVSVALLANKLATARELLGRLQMAYEHLPHWLQQGVETWNKGSIELENGSRIMAAATSSSAIRGGSFNILFLDEFAFVPIELAEEFFNSVYPTISSGQSTKVIIVSTPQGMNHFYKLWVDAEEGRNSYVPIEVHWSEVPGRDEKWKAMTIKNTSAEQFRQEFDTEFLGSTNTLINFTKLKNMPYKTPRQSLENGTVKIYEKAKKNHIYFMTVDVSRGKGMDYSTFSIFDCTDVPYKQVVTFRSNEIPPMVFPTVINRMSDLYNEALILVEINDVGQQVSDILYHDLENVNLISISSDNRKGQTISGGFGGQNKSLGIRTTKATKKIGCMNLKSLIEEDKLYIRDFETINELTTFVQKGPKFEAEKGRHDDLVDTLILFSWMATDPYFKAMCDVDIRKEIYNERMRHLEEDMLPFGFIQSGMEGENFVDDSGDFWTVDTT